MSRRPNSKSRSNGVASSEFALHPVAKLRPHPCAELVPALQAAEATALAADISARGILRPLEINAEGVVLDGHERLRVARTLGLVDVPVRIVQAVDERSYILLEALLRKHLNPGQRALIALDLAEIEQERTAARTRQRANLRQYAEVAKLPPRGIKTRDRVAELTGASARTVQDAETVRSGDPDLCAAVRQGVEAVSKAALTVRRERRYAEIGTAPPLPAGEFELIYADPPWRLGNPAAAYAPENYYPTLPLEETKALEVPAAKDACLFLWAVNSQLPEALEVMAAWGFAYRTSLCWDKQSIGLGVWARNRHELLLFGIRGSFSPPEPKNRCDSVIEAPRGRHSAKPVQAYERIERMYPRASKLELFARGKVRPGWVAWGNEVSA